MAIPTARAVWRKYNTDGVPASGMHDPEKPEIEAWGAYLESLLSGGGPGLGYATLALLNADLAHAANALAIVYADASPASNGTYQKAGASGSGAWLRIDDLPGDLVLLTVTGGTGNAITATAPETPTVPGAKLYLLTPTTSNTGATTIAVNGGVAVSIKNAFGSSLASGSLINGSQVLMAWQTDHYQLLISAVVDGSAILADTVAARDVASSYATAAASSASALGNQVHQYDTRALAAAATIPVGVQAIKITRYATGYPLSYATYVPGTNAGPMAFAEAGGHYWELDLSGGVINPHWYGAIGNDSTDNQTILAAVITKAVASNYAIEFQPGIYRFSGNLNFGPSEFRTTFVGLVTLKHTGAGTAISLDSGPNVPDVSMRCQFGWGNPPLITGNASTLKLLYVRGWHHGKCAARLGDAHGTSGYGFHNQFSVCSQFDIEISTNSQFFLISRPAIPFAVDIRNSGELSTDCDYNVICEGQKQGLALSGVQVSRFTGTSEGNDSSGVILTSACNGNVLERFHCEGNGAGVPSSADIALGGGDNLLLYCNCGSTGPTNALSVTGGRNRIVGGVYASVTVFSGVARNHFENAILYSFTDAATATRLIDCCNSAGTYYTNQLPT